MAKLRIQWPDGREQEYEITRTITMLGRTSDNDLKLADRGISRKQCKIEGSPGNYSVVDLDSKNGTMVNGTKVSTSQLKHNDRILVGKITLMFIEEDGTGTTSGPPPASGSAGGAACPSCGAGLREGDVLCIKCGTFIRKAGQTGRPGGAAFLRDNWLSWVILGAVALALVIGGILVVRGGDRDDRTDPADIQARITAIVRGIQTPTMDRTYGELLDDLNIAATDMHWEIEDRGLHIYRAVLSFTTDKGYQRMVFKVDLQSGDGKDILDEFMFNDF